MQSNLLRKQETRMEAWKIVNKITLVFKLNVLISSLG